MSKGHRAAAQVLARHALAELEAGRLARADVLIRWAISRDPACGDAYHLFARLAQQLGRPDAAVRILEAGAQADPYHKPVRKALAAAEAAAAGWAGLPPADGSRLMLIKSWGHGFWSDVYHVLAGCLLAEFAGRTPVVHWGEGCLFHEPGRADAWSEVFEPVSSVPLAQALAHAGPVYHSRWSGRLGGPLQPAFDPDGGRMHGPLLLSRTEPVVVCDFATPIVAVLPWATQGHWSLGQDPNHVLRALMDRYARPNARAVECAQAAARTLPDPDSCIAVHIRGTDKIIENANLWEQNNDYAQAIDGVLAGAPDARLFLLTDDLAALAAAQRRYGDRLVTLPAARARGDQGVHIARTAPPAELAMQVLVDVLLAARCRWFVGLGTSNVSTAVYHRRHWPAGHAHLIGGCWHEIDYSGPTLHGPF